MAPPLGLLLRLLGALPLPLLHGVGVFSGQLFSLVPNRHRRVTWRNLQLCFPDMGERQRARLLVQSLQETGKTFMETALMWNGSRRRLLGLVREVEGEALLCDALARGKGVILAAPHLGSWELIGHYIAERAPITCLYKPPRSPAVAAAMRAGRTHLGVKLAATDSGGVKSLLSILRAGEVAGILPDQDPSDGGGVFAPFFGIDANTMTLLPRLAAKSGATVLVSYAERLPWGRGYRLHFIPCDAALNGRDPLQAATALNAAVEAAIRHCPAQYQWSYKRFRSRPHGEPGLY
ncbi:MAG: lysophospholipid acyltransferase family protein [Gammaproteobacteria bacterium]|nr:lysophospholipid acyltransferase family protein [Gammaproteobacteria bacterium]